LLIFIEKIIEGFSIGNEQFRTEIPHESTSFPALSKGFLN